MVDEEKRTSEALDASKKYNTVVEEANDYIEHFDILETITNVGNDEVFTPRKVCDLLLDTLPEEVWHNPLYKWLNPATKNGIFEREIALRLDKGLEDVIPDKEERRKHILQNMIFSIGQTKFTSNVARRTLYYCSQANRKCDGIKAPDGHYVNGYSIGNGSWFDDEEGNIKTPCAEHIFLDSNNRRMPSTCKPEDRKKYRCRCGISGDSKYNDANQRENYAYEFIHINHLILEKHLQSRFFGGDKKMKFDIIIGNPPYHLNDSGAGSSAKPIYHFFVNQAIDLKPRYICMIIPSRWMAGGKGLDDFRASMLKDTHMRILHDYPDAKMCFPLNDIPGGVCYFLWDSKHDGVCEITQHQNDGSTVVSKRKLADSNSDIVLRDPIHSKILKKVLSKKYKSISTIVSSRKPYGLATDFLADPSKYNLPKLSEKPVPGGIRIIGKNNSLMYAKKDYPLPKRTHIDEYKLFIGRANGGAGILGEKIPCNVMAEPITGKPGDACVETYLEIAPFENEFQMVNCITYMKTRFFRLMVGIKKVSQDFKPDSFEYAPLLDFNKSWSDEELFEMFGFNEEEINYAKKYISSVSWSGKRL